MNSRMTASSYIDGDDNNIPSLTLTEDMSVSPEGSPIASSYVDSPAADKDQAGITRGMKPFFDPLARTAKGDLPAGAGGGRKQNDNGAERKEQGGAKPPSISKQLDFSNLRTFLTTPIPPNFLMQCYIVRDRKGFSKKLFPTYELYLQSEDRFLLAAQKKASNKTSNYCISYDRRDLEKDGPCYLGKVRSNFVGTEFVFFDSGKNPQDFSPNSDPQTAREELGCALYESNIMGSRGPRKMSVLLPSVDRKNQRTLWKPIKSTESILAAHASGNEAGLITLMNKTPKWNDQVGAYVLNFNGRVTMASVKNFQLIDEADPDTVVLQFGRVGKELFTMDFMWPLSPMQAFMICISSFDYKLACE